MVFQEPISFRSLPPGVKALLGLCVGTFALQWVLSFTLGWNIVGLLGLTPARVTGQLWLWQVVTYMFLHGGPFHLLFNAYMLWALGRIIEERWGTGSFLLFFLLCGAGAAALNLALEPRALTPVVGASGAIYGLLVAFAMMFPDAVFLVMFIVPMRAKHAVIFFALVELMFSASANASHIANLAHLGGMATGFLYMKSGTIRYDLRLWWGRLKDRRERRKAPPVRLYEVGREVDRILEKISSHGRESLTREERDLLERYSRMKR